MSYYDSVNCVGTHYQCMLCCFLAQLLCGCSYNTLQEVSVCNPGEFCIQFVTNKILPLLLEMNYKFNFCRRSFIFGLMFSKPYKSHKKV